MSANPAVLNLGTRQEGFEVGRLSTCEMKIGLIFFIIVSNIT